MRLNPDFILHTTEYDESKTPVRAMMVPVGASALKHNVEIELNETAIFVCNCLMKDTDVDGIVKALMNEYEGEEGLIRNSVIKVIDSLKSVGAVLGD